MSEHWNEFNKTLPEMDPAEVLRIANNKFEPDVARVMTAIAIAESNIKAGMIGDSGGSVGLWQINRIHYQDLVDYGIIDAPPEAITEENSFAQWVEFAHPQLSDPIVNAEAAWMVGWGQGPSGGVKGNNKRLAGEFDFDQWTQYRNGSWQSNAINYLSDPSHEGKSPLDIVDGLGDGEVGRLSVDDGLGEGSRLNPQDSTTWGWDADFGERMQRAADHGDIDFQAVAGRMNPGEIAALRQQLGPNDPRIASVLSQAQFPEGRAAIVGYRTAEDARKAPVILRKFGLTTHPEFPFFISPVGGDLFDAGKDILSQLSDWAMGSLFNRRGDSQEISEDHIGTKIE